MSDEPPRARAMECTVAEYAELERWCRAKILAALDRWQDEEISRRLATEKRRTKRKTESARLRAAPIRGLSSNWTENGVPQKPIEGTSLAYTFDDAKALSTHRTQYFEMFANRAIHNDGRIACTTPPIAPWVFGAQLPDVDSYKCELYKVNDDFSEPNDLAAREPKKLRELQDLFGQKLPNTLRLPLASILRRER